MLDEDQPGIADLLQVRRFFTDVAPFERFRPADIVSGEYPAGHRPLALATRERDVVAIYFPACRNRGSQGADHRRSAMVRSPRSGALVRPV